MFPSVPQDGDRDPWDADVSREIARSAPRSAAGVYGAVPDDAARSDAGEVEDDEEFEVEVAPVRPPLSLAIGGFAALLTAALVLGAQTSGPDSRWPYAVVILGVQVLFVLAWTMAMRPPVPVLPAGVALVAAVYADHQVVTADAATVGPLFWVVLIGTAVVVAGQFAMRVHRLRVRDALGSTVLIIGGAVAFAVLVALTRRPAGVQAVLVCLGAAGVALVLARLIDAVFPRPRIAPQVARGATGIIAGAMAGTLAAAGLGSVLVLPFDPAKGAILGLIAAGAAVLVDLAVNFTEAGRGLDGDAPTFWLARHMQGPLGAFALAAPAAYLLTSVVLT